MIETLLLSEFIKYRIHIYERRSRRCSIRRSAVCWRRGRFGVESGDPFYAYGGAAWRQGGMMSEVFARE